MESLVLGVDVGGTKVLAAVIDANGDIRCIKKKATPRGSSSATVVKAIVNLIETILRENKFSASDLNGIGIAIPGVVDTEKGTVILTPNMPLSGVSIGSTIKKHFKLPVYCENDVNLGTLGEAWLGAGRNKQSAVGIFIGTGIGGGIVLNGKLYEGFRHAAGEIGHMVMQPDGPVCGCGNRGCLESFASRSAIERALREAIAGGRKSVLQKLSDGNLSLIKSGMLKRALKKDDPLVTEVIHAASKMLGYACLSVRHLLDPEAIILGGGVIEACGGYVLPVVRDIVNRYSMPGSSEKQVILQSTLGDNAVVIGAAALVLQRIEKNDGRNLKKERKKNPPPVFSYIKRELLLNGRSIEMSIFIDSAGMTGELKIRNDFSEPVSSTYIRGKIIKKVCADNPQQLFIAAPPSMRVSLSHTALAYLENHQIILKCISFRYFPGAFRKYKKSKSAIILV